MRKNIYKVIILMALPLLLYSCSEKRTSGEATNNKKEKSPITSTEVIHLNSSSKELNEAFSWAKQTALSYVNDGDPVGPWYEAALPDRESFCMRDVAHMSIGAYYLGLSKYNKNMLLKFAQNISESRDYCSYWEINKNNKPTPVDYLSDDDFWYNLPANFDVMFACYQLYNLTGDEDYLTEDTFFTFHSQSVNEYVKAWDSDGDGIMNSPIGRAVHRRGIGSYEEQISNIEIGADLIAAQAKGYEVFSEILTLKNKKDQGLEYLKLSDNLKQRFDQNWWDPNDNIFFGYKLEDGSYSKSSKGDLVLHFDLVENKEKIDATLAQIEKSNKNVESKSYFPMIFYKYGRPEKAYEYLIEMANPAEKRRNYPEVSFSFIGSISEGLMGINIDSPNNTIQTKPNLPMGLDWVELNQVPFQGGFVDIKNTGLESTTITSKVNKPFTWVVYFPGYSKTFWVNQQKVETKSHTDFNGNSFVYAEILVQPNAVHTVSINKI